MRWEVKPQKAGTMDRQGYEFAVVTQGKVVTAVVRSTVFCPRVNYTGKGIKWFDDTKLIKQPQKKEGKQDERMV